MKAILFSLLLMAPVGSLLAQGTIVFCNNVSNGSSPLQAPIYGPDPSDPFNPKQGNTANGIPAGTQTYGGALLSGAGYTVALYTMVGDNIVEIDRSAFGTGSSAGYWNLKIVTDPFHAPGSTMTAIVRTWDNKGGTVTSWEQAMATGGTPVGQSVPFTIKDLGGGTEYGTNIPPPTIGGMSSFNITQRGGAFITEQPGEITVPAGSAAQMRVQVASDGGAPSFLWQRNGSAIAGATSSTLAFTPVQYSDAGSYSAIITTTSLSLTSQVAQLRVQPTIASIDRFYIPEWGSSAIRLSYDSTPLRPVRVEVRSSLLDAWTTMGRYVNSDVRGYFFDIEPTTETRFYRLSVEP